jgi:hypothetical protein
MSGERVRRKRKEKEISLDEIFLIDEAVRRENRNEAQRKREKKTKGSSRASQKIVRKTFPFVEEEESSLGSPSGTPPLRLCLSSTCLGEGDEVTLPPSLMSSSSLCLSSTCLGEGDEVTLPPSLMSSSSMSMSSSWISTPLPPQTPLPPLVPSGWWVQFIFLQKFGERLKWSWKHKAKSFGGSFPLPLSIFNHFFDGVGKVKTTPQRITITIDDEEDFFLLDERLGGSPRWRKKNFTFKDGAGALVPDGTNFVVLRTKKKIPEISKTSLIECLCPLKFSFIYEESAFYFKGTVEGRNSDDFFHY